MWHLESAKELKLANTLRRGYDVAKTKQAQYSEELQNFQQQSEDLGEDAELLSHKGSAAPRSPVVSALLLVHGPIGKNHVTTCNIC